MINDTILKSYLNNFSENFSCTTDDESQQFEKFVNYIVFSRQYINKITPDVMESVSIGGGQDAGFDGIGIIVNGTLIQNAEQYDYFLKNGHSLNIRFIFVQSKARPHFRSCEVDNFYFGVCNFFNDNSDIEESSTIKKFRKIKEKIYNNALNFDENPQIYMYYATVGEWKSPKDIIAREKKCVEDLNNKKIFSQVNCQFIDAEKLKVWFQELKRKNIKQIVFKDKVALPDISGVNQSFIGSLPMSEFITMITDSDGNLQKTLFEDNVRHFQGGNKVNKEIEATLKNKEQDALPIFNNGITIITKKLEQIGNNLKLTDFQIVNGCQSAHIFFKNKDIINNNTNIIVKIIETTEQSLINKIIKATNKQTLVTDEAFESLSNFHRDLEEYYYAKSKTITNPIFYERRSKQYDDNPDIKATQIVTLAVQIQAYVATVLAQPHSTHRYYGELLISNREKLFSGSRYENYYISSLILNRLDSLFRTRKIDYKYKNFRFQIIYIAFYYFNEFKQRDKKFNNESIIEMLNSEKKYLTVLKSCCDVIDEELKKLPEKEKRDAYRVSKFTDSIRENIINQFNSKP